MIELGQPAFWRATVALALGSFMIFANVYLTQPLLPLLAEDFDISPLLAGWSFTATTLMLGLSLLIYGPLSDALGRRPIMLVTMSCAVLTTLALALVQDYLVLLALRALQGVFLGGLPAVAIAYMGDEFSKRAVAVAVGLYISGNSLGGIGGRLIGGFVGEWLGWSNAFLVMSGVGLACLLAFALLLPRSRHFSARPLRPRGMLTDLALHLRNPALVLVYIIGGLNFLIFVNQYSYITFVLSEAPYHLPPGMLGLLFLTYLSGTVGSTLAGCVAPYLGQPRCMALGILMLIVGSLVTLIPGLPAILLGLLINSFGFFFAHSSAGSWVSHNAERAKASASSLYLVFYYLGASSGGFYLHPFWGAAGWSGVVAGSLPVLGLTLGCALWLARRKAPILAAV